MAAPENPAHPAPVGEPFSRFYIERGAPAQDNQLFRNRLTGYLQSKHYNDYGEIALYLRQEGGLLVPTSYLAGAVYWDFPKFFTDTAIEHVLSAITFIWRFLRAKYSTWAPAKAPTLDDMLA